MRLSAEQISDVEQSFSQILPLRDQVAALFYDRLFAIAPELRPLFKGDIAQQGAKLMGTLSYIVDSLDDLDTLIPMIEALAQRHNDYGVEAEHYTPVGDALIWTLRQTLGSSFGGEIEAAWIATYTTLSTVMISAAHAAPAPQSGVAAE